MKRKGDFRDHIKIQAYNRQGGKCAFCGVQLRPIGSNSNTDYIGHAHHLIPLYHNGTSDLQNCVYLCYGCHMLIGHGASPYKIDKQGGSSKTRICLYKRDFKYWKKNTE